MTWATIYADTVARIGAITPSQDPRQRWSHIPDSRELAGGRDRVFRTLPPETSDASSIAGAGYAQLTWTVPVVSEYLPTTVLAGRVAADWVDLTRALSPKVTYPAGLRVRRVEQPRTEQDTEKDRVVVTYPVVHIYRVRVTLV